MSTEARSPGGRYRQPLAMLREQSRVKLAGSPLGPGGFACRLCRRSLPTAAGKRVRTARPPPPSPAQLLTRRRSLGTRPLPGRWLWAVPGLRRGGPGAWAARPGRARVVAGGWGGRGGAGPTSRGGSRVGPLRACTPEQSRRRVLMLRDGGHRARAAWGAGEQQGGGGMGFGILLPFHPAPPKLLKPCAGLWWRPSFPAWKHVS